MEKPRWKDEEQNRFYTRNNKNIVTGVSDLNKFHNCSDYWLVRVQIQISTKIENKSFRKSPRPTLKMLEENKIYSILCKQSKLWKWSNSPRAGDKKV